MLSYVMRSMLWDVMRSGRGRLIAAAGSVVFIVVGPAPRAAAQEPAGEDIAEIVEELDVGDLEKECLELLVEGEGVDACYEAPNSVLPPRDEVIWSLIGFAVIAGAFVRFGLPRVRQATAARTERIRRELDDAATARQAAEAVAAEYRAQLEDARLEAERIVAEASSRAVQLKQEMLERTNDSLADMRAKAQSDIEAMWAQAGDDLRRDFVAIVTEATEHVVREGLDSSIHERLVDDYIVSLELRRN